MIPSCLVTYGVSSVPSWLASMIVPSYLSSQSVQHVDLQGLQTFRLSDRGCRSVFCFLRLSNDFLQGRKNTTPILLYFFTVINLQLNKI